MIRLRVDDWPTTRPDERHKHTNEMFDEFDRVVQEAWGKKYLLGVIPAHVSDDDLRWLATKNLVVGMHGLDHDETKQNDLDGIRADVCMERLKEQRQRFRALTGQEVETYLPPHNITDDFSLAQLKGAGFTTFTSGPETGDLSTAFLKRVDSRGWLYGRSDELLRLPEWKLWIEHGSHVTRLLAHEQCLTLHWTWEASLNNGFSTLRRLLETARAQAKDWE